MSNTTDKLLAIVVATNLTEAEAICAPAVLTRFADGNGSEAAMAAEILSNRRLRDYFAKVCRTMADSPEGRKVAADFAQARHDPRR